MAESLLLKQQLVVLNRGNQRSPKLQTTDRIILGLLTNFIPASRINKLAVVIKPATPHRFHRLLVQRKYRWLFSSLRMLKPGPKGPSPELVAAIVAMKQKNPRMGCPQIAAQISHAFDIDIDKDVVRRVLAKHLHQYPFENDGPSWLAFLAQMKVSLWSIDFFHAESINLRTFVVMVILDVYSRRIIGFAILPYTNNGPDVCAMFRETIN